MEEVKVYRSFDGYIFDTEEECEGYEDELRKNIRRMNEIKYGYKGVSDELAALCGICAELISSHKDLFNGYAKYFASGNHCDMHCDMERVLSEQSNLHTQYRPLYDTYKELMPLYIKIYNR